MLRLLVDSRYRVFRHFLLFFLSMLIISVNFYLDLIEGKESLIRSSIAQSLILLIPIYLSVFILTPRLLLKNKLGEVCHLRVFGYRCGYFVFLSAAAGRYRKRI